MSFERWMITLGFSTPKSLWVVTYNNVLKELFCPFQVRVNSDIGKLKKGDVVWVQRVLSTRELRLVFEIYEKLYYYQYFNIICK